MIKTIYRTAILLLFTLSFHILYAQNPAHTINHSRHQVDEWVEESAPASTSVPVSAKKALVADKAKTTAETLAADSMLMKMTAKVEDMLYPADDLYDGSWNEEHVKAYQDKVIPNEYTINVSEFVMPADGRVTSPFGWRKRRMHNGIDIKVQTGEPIRAAFDGKVRVKKYQRKGYGYYLVLRHPNGLETVYGHLSKFMVEQDEYVKAGQVIGLGGNTGRSTGSHLHFEFRFLGQAINPEHIVDFENKCIKDDTYVFNKAKSSTYTNKYASKSGTQSKSSTSNSSSNSANAKYHKIKDGDTLGAIALKHKTTVSKLCRLNNIKATTTLRVGRSLRVS